jgi:hypothetical protein
MLKLKDALIKVRAATLWSALTLQARQPGCPAGDPASALWPVPTCRGLVMVEFISATGVKPPQAKAATGRRTPKSSR